MIMIDGLLIEPGGANVADRLNWLVRYSRVGALATIGSSRKGGGKVARIERKSFSSASGMGARLIKQFSKMVI